MIQDQEKVASSARPRGTTGFIGIGVMGEPMVFNLLWGGVPLVVWSRRRESMAAVEAAGASVAPSVAALFAASHTVILMLVDEQATDAVLRRDTPDFAERVRGRTIVNMATTSPAYSKALEADLLAAGARYVEAPVSGQRPVAEAAQLVAMVAGAPDTVAEVTPLLQPMCRSVVPCGPVPGGLSMKLAVNLVSGVMMTALAEGAHYAARQGLDLNLFASVLNVTSLASTFTRMKLPKLVEEDFSVQGAIRVGRKDFDMMRDTAAAKGAAIPLLEASAALWDEAISLGHGEEDVSVVLRAYQARDRTPGPTPR